MDDASPPLSDRCSRLCRRSAAGEQFLLHSPALQLVLCIGWKRSFRWAVDTANSITRTLWDFSKSLKSRTCSQSFNIGKPTRIKSMRRTTSCIIIRYPTLSYKSIMIQKRSSGVHAPPHSISGRLSAGDHASETRDSLMFCHQIPRCRLQHASREPRDSRRPWTSSSHEGIIPRIFCRGCLMFTKLYIPGWATILLNINMHVLIETIHYSKRTRTPRRINLSADTNNMDRWINGMWSFHSNEINSFKNFSFNDTNSACFHESKTVPSFLFWNPWI